MSDVKDAFIVKKPSYKKHYAGEKIKTEPL